MLTLERVAPQAPAVLEQPRLRGMLHAALFPPVLVAGLVLVALGPTETSRLAAVVYVLTSALLFGVSAAFHRGRWSPRIHAVLRRLDHANIYLSIAGTYVPFAVLGLDGDVRRAALTVVGVGTVVGITVRLGWQRAPRWLTVGLYLGLGWMATLFAPELFAGNGHVPMLLVVAGGLLYSAGAIVYALQRPDPSPHWFGFHEVFHAFTVAAYALHFAAVSLVVAGHG